MNFYKPNDSFCLILLYNRVKAKKNIYKQCTLNTLINKNLSIFMSVDLKMCYVIMC